MIKKIKNFRRAARKDYSTWNLEIVFFVILISILCEFFSYYSKNNIKGRNNNIEMFFDVLKHRNI